MFQAIDFHIHKALDRWDIWEVLIVQPDLVWNELSHY